MEFKRITDPILVPESALLQIRDRDWDVKEFYMTLSKASGHATGTFNQNCLLYILLEEPGKIAGFFWAEINPMTNSIWLHNFSVAKHLWNKDVAVPLITDKLKELCKLNQCKKILWLTPHEKACVKHGFEPSKIKLMQYTAPDEKTQEEAHAR